jgi:hypothetical protein
MDHGATAAGEYLAEGVAKSRGFEPAKGVGCAS